MLIQANKVIESIQPVVTHGTDPYSPHAKWINNMLHLITFLGSVLVAVFVAHSFCRKEVENIRKEFESKKNVTDIFLNNLSGRIFQLEYIRKFKKGDSVKYKTKRHKGYYEGVVYYCGRVDGCWMYGIEVKDKEPQYAREQDLSLIVNKT
jgi:hypothetical protein